MVRGRWAVPVIEDLAEEDAVEEEACDEAIWLLVKEVGVWRRDGESGDEPRKDDFVVDFLQRREDTHQGSEKIVQNLQLTISTTQARQTEERPKKKTTHRKRTQLPRPPLPPHRPNLRRLTHHPRHPSPHLRNRQPLPPHRLQHPPSPNQPHRKHPRQAAPPGKPQHQPGHHDVLRQDQRALPIRAERVPAARVVRHAHDIRRDLEHVGEEADARRGLGLQQFEDLGDFDNGGGGDDGEAEGFGEGEGEAGGGREGEVEEEGFVAGGAEEGEAEGAEGWGEVVGDGLEVGAEVVHCWVLGYEG